MDTLDDTILDSVFQIAKGIEKVYRYIQNIIWLASSNDINMKTTKK